MKQHDKQKIHGEKQIWWHQGFKVWGPPTRKSTRYAKACKVNIYEVQNNNLQNLSTPDTNLTPKKIADELYLLIVNFQSILGKKEELGLMLLDNNIDIILGSETHLRTHTWLRGNMNLPDISWETNSVIKHEYLKDINDCFLGIFLSCNLEQIVTTRGINTLEIVATNQPNLCQQN